MRTFVNISELADYGVQLSEYQAKRQAEAKKNLATFAPLCRLVEVAYLSHYDDKYHIEDADVLLEYKGRMLRAYHTHYTDTAYKFCLSEQYSHRHTACYRNTHPTPNKVGAPTAKKMDEWLNYLLTEDAEKKAYAQEYIDKEMAFRAQLAQFGDAISWYGDNNGRITINNVVLEFEIAPCSISQKVSIDQTRNLGISGFLQMADNKYRPAQA
jgi:disulfide oxidoreductase YuzD